METKPLWKRISFLIKFMYSEKATKFCQISTLLLSTVHTDKSKVEILQNFVAFSEYMNFTTVHGSYEWIIMLEKCGRLDLTVFHLIWVIGTYGNWKNQNPGGRFGATS